MVSLDDLVGLLGPHLDREALLRGLAVPAGFEHHLDEIAREVRRLRYYADPDSSLAYLADRLANHLEALLLMHAASAADYVRAGLDVDEALAIVDRHAAELQRRMGRRL